MSAPLPSNEAERLAALHATGLLDSLPEAAFDDLVQLAAFICQTPVSLVSLVDGDRQWFKAKQGTDVPETPREMSFCAHALLQPDELLVVPDAQADARFANNALVTGALGIRFYAGMPIKWGAGFALGTLCVIDVQPRTLTTEQADALKRLARQVSAHIEARRQRTALERIEQETADRASALARANLLLHFEMEERKTIQAARERLIGELQTALADVKTLSGLLPICGWCRKVRDDSGSWNSLEAYLKKTSGRDVTHGICPECNTRMLHELDQLVPEDFAPPPR